MLQDDGPPKVHGARFSQHIKQQEKVQHVPSVHILESSTVNTPTAGNTQGGELDPKQVLLA